MGIGMLTGMYLGNRENMEHMYIVVAMVGVGILIDKCGYGACGAV